eukprot:m.47301 g.47301  ORF g.47301 m.47301 type:complete len:101 (+) comp6872_c0_seq2:617-919(+)
MSTLAPTSPTSTPRHWRRWCSNDTLTNTSCMSTVPVNPNAQSRRRHNNYGKRPVTRHSTSTPTTRRRGITIFDDNAINSRVCPLSITCISGLPTPSVIAS